MVVHFLIVHRHTYHVLTLVTMTRRFTTTNRRVDTTLPITKKKVKHFSSNFCAVGGSETARRLKENASLYFCMR